MESIGINVGYLVMQVCILLAVPIILLTFITYYLNKKGFLRGAETVRIIEITDEGVMIPKQLLTGMEAVAIKKKQGILYLVPVKRKAE